MTVRELFSKRTELGETQELRHGGQRACEPRGARVALEQPASRAVV
jgi:hypothetical protein